MAYSEGYPSEGEMQDVASHPDVNLPDPGHGPAMQHSTKMAGDVLPIPGELSMGSGMTSSALDYARGLKTDPKVVTIPSKQMTSGANRVLQQLSK